MDPYNLNPIYKEVIARNFLEIRLKGFAPDKKLKDLSYPDTSCAIFSPLVRKDSLLTSNFLYLMDFFRNHPETFLTYEFEQDTLGKNPNECGVLHHTILQILTFGKHQELLEKHQDKYIEILKEFLPEILPLEIMFRKICITPKGIIALGYPHKDVNAWRDKLREKLGSLSLPLFEPIQTNIVHVSLARVCGIVRPEVLEKLMLLIDTIQDTNIFLTTISKWNFGLGSWRLHHSENKILLRV